MKSACCWTGGIDLLGNRVEAEVGVAFFIACYSILRNSAPLPAVLILGDMSIQGNIKPVRSLMEPLQVGMDKGAKYTKRHVVFCPMREA